MLRFAVPVVFPSGLARSIRSARVVALIPARYHSTRLPGKPLARLDDKTMIEHVYRRASDARLVDLAIVATDDDRIAEVVADFGGIAVMTSADHATGSDRLAEVAAALESALMVKVQGDDVAIVTGIARESGTTADGKRFTNSRRFTDTWVKRNGKWRCVASHTTAIPKD